MNVVAPSVRDKVAQVRRSVQRLRRWVTVSLLLLAMFVLAAVVAIVDYYYVLSTPVRALALLLGTAGIVAAAWRFAWGRLTYADPEAAADVEAKFPEYGQRIRTTLDYASGDRPTASADAGMVACLSADTEQRTAASDFSPVVDRRPLWLSLAGLAIAGVIALVALVRAPELWISAGRTLLLPIQYTELTVEGVDRPLPSGEDATIIAKIEGRPVSFARLLHRRAGANEAWSEMDMAPPEIDAEAPGKSLVGELSATLEDCQHDLEYCVVAGPRKSDVFHVRVLQPLELKSITAEVTPPEYTRLAPESADTLDLKVIEGTNVDFQVALNRPPAKAELVDLSEDAAQSSAALAIEGAALTGRFADLQQTKQFVINAEAADGMEYRSPKFRIWVRPDGKPKIRFVKPPEELEVIPTTEVTLAVDASDDFGIRKVGVAAQVADGPMQTLWEQDYSEEQPLEMKAQPALYLEEHDVTFQDAVTYYAYAVDNWRGEGRRTVTELRFVDIRPFKREYQILQSGGT